MLLQVSTEYAETPHLGMNHLFTTQTAQQCRSILVLYGADHHRVLFVGHKQDCTRHHLTKDLQEELSENNRVELTFQDKIKLLSFSQMQYLLQEITSKPWSFQCLYRTNCKQV